MNKAQQHFQEFEALLSDRSSFNAQWEEAAQIVVPGHGGTFWAPGDYSTQQGAKKTERQYDATAALACLRFASVIESLSTPQSGIWHRIVPADKQLRKNKQVRVWFDDITDLLFSYRYRPVANFVGNSQQAYLGLGAYGNGVLYVDKPDDTPGLRYRNIHIGEIFFAESHAGVINKAYRKFSLTPEQAVGQFGVDNVPDQIKAALNNPTQKTSKFQFLHCVYPNNAQRGVLTAAGMPFASVYYDVDSKKEVRTGGYRSWPFPTTRYTQMPGETYGRGPAQWVLPSIKTLNEQKKVMLKQGHRAVDPVLLAHDDGIMDGLSIRPGAVNYGAVNADGRPLVQVLPTGNMTIGEKMMEMERTVINDAFLLTLFQILVETPQMTATEVLERAREKGMLVAPTAGRMQAEFLGAMIDRELDLLEQQNLLPPPPPILVEQGGRYKIEYDSPMSRMQRAEKAAGFMRALGTAAEYVKMTADPRPLDWFDVDTAFPEIIDIQGAPAAWINDLDAVMALRDQRAQQAQQQQMVDAAPALASVAKAAPELANLQGAA